MRALCLTIALLSIGCGADANDPDAGPAPTDASASDAGRAMDAEVTPDAGPTDSGVAGDPDAGVDSGIDGADAATPRPDAGMPSLGPVQCRTSDDCGGSAICSRSAPGGVCNGCGTDADCPSGTECTPFGACVRFCDTDADCNVGFRCRGSGQCSIRGCETDADCAPYVCGGSGQCERPACAGGAPCPSPFTCSADVCLEP